MGRKDTGTILLPGRDRHQGTFYLYRLIDLLLLQHDLFGLTPGGRVDHPDLCFACRQDQPAGDRQLLLKDLPGCVLVELFQHLDGPRLVGGV